MKRKKVHGDQVLLTTGMTARNVESKQDLEQNIANLKIAVEIANQLLDEGEESRVLWALTIERYGSGRLTAADWWLAPDEMEDEDERREETGKPKAEDYEWGSYWRGHRDGSENFVRDRAKWMLPRLMKDLEEALAEYAEIKPFVDSPEIGATPKKGAEEKEWREKRGEDLKRTTMENWTT